LPTLRPIAYLARVLTRSFLPAALLLLVPLAGAQAAQQGFSIRLEIRAPVRVAVAAPGAARPVGAGSGQRFVTAGGASAVLYVAAPPGGTTDVVAEPVGGPVSAAAQNAPPVTILIQ
jgi:hypothetical protein